MNIFKTTAFAAALAAGTALAAPAAFAQDANVETETDASSDILKKRLKGDASAEKKPAGEPADQSASENAPGQMQKSGEADSAAEAAPGQMQNSGEVDSASEAAPGQTKDMETTASIDISAEQRTEIREVIVETDVEPIDVDFDVNVGVAVPDTVVLHPLPPRIIEIVPVYEGYQYFVLADGRIIIVEPDTLEIVYVVTA